MPAFVLVEEVDDLSFDFSSTSNPDGAKGTIPDPSAKQINTFQKKLRAISKEIRRTLGKLDKDTDPDKAGAEEEASDTEVLAAALESADDALVGAQDAIVAAVAGVCGGHPTLAEIQALPYRAQQAFIGWVTGTFLDPQPSKPATK